jgi:hypothetical protein
MKNHLKLETPTVPQWVEGKPSCDTTIQWNIPQQQEGIAYWCMQHIAWVSKAVCKVEEANLTSSAVCHSTDLTFSKDRKAVMVNKPVFTKGLWRKEDATGKWLDFGRYSCSVPWLWRWLHKFVHVLKFTELYTWVNQPKF